MCACGFRHSNLTPQPNNHVTPAAAIYGADTLVYSGRLKVIPLWHRGEPPARVEHHETCSLRDNTGT